MQILKKMALAAAGATFSVFMKIVEKYQNVPQKYRFWSHLEAILAHFGGSWRLLEALGTHFWHLEANLEPT